jgi:superfamily II DNA or RNA helicase
LIVRSDLRLARDELSEGEWRKLFKRLTFYDADRNEVKAYRILKGGTVRLHRGSWALLPDHVEYVDKRVCPDGHRYASKVRLDAPGFSGQNDALDSIFEQEQGLVIAQPGFGKTQVALAFIATVKTPTIVFVHTKDIFDQWMQYAKSALPDIPLGFISEGTWNVRPLTIAMVQSVAQDTARWKELSTYFGAVVVDEAHHSPAATWEAILTASPARYRLGFTATETRADGMHPLMRQLIGPVIFKQAFKSKVPVEVVPIKSGFSTQYRGSMDWGILQANLIRDEKRNRVIAEVAAKQIADGHSVLILSRRVEHLERVEGFICESLALTMRGCLAGDTVVLTSKSLTRPQRRQLQNDFRSGKVKCVLATQLADEALDIPRLDRVMLTYPGKHDGRIIQQVGRALREHPDKKDAVIYDIVDNKIGVLHRQWKERERTYKKLKIPIIKREEITHVSKATQRRIVSNRIRQRLAQRRSHHS